MIILGLVPCIDARGVGINFCHLVTETERVYM